jgi:hypothetical protein
LNDGSHGRLFTALHNQPPSAVSRLATFVLNHTQPDQPLDASSPPPPPPPRVATHHYSVSFQFPNSDECAHVDVVRHDKKKPVGACGVFSIFFFADFFFVFVFVQ